jgi:predicted acyltransferase
MLRGMAVAAMIAVNNPGNWLAVFPWLQHASWNGCTPADLVFPAFLVIMGLAMPFAFARRHAAGSRARRGVHTHIVTRTATLLALGLLLNVVAAWSNLDAVRFPGVLQRIAIVYAVTALLVLHTSVAVQAIVAVGLGAAHWALLTLVPFGGHPAGTLTPTVNLASTIDRFVFGAHMLTPTLDPEGLLGTLTSIATALAGALAGRWFRALERPRPRFSGLAAAGFASILLGLVWARSWPLNKSLWTGSYVLVAAGVAVLAFAACDLIVDVWKKDGRWAQPFLWLGMNPLAIYFGSEFVGHLMDIPLRHGTTLGVKEVLFWQGLAPLVHDSGGVWASLVFALAYTTIWTLAAGALHRRGIIVHV